jgi:hypothetical protein
VQKRHIFYFFGRTAFSRRINAAAIETVQRLQACNFFKGIRTTAVTFRTVHTTASTASRLYTNNRATALKV